MDTSAPTPAPVVKADDIPPPTTRPQAERLVSVDALRGFDMFWIVGGEAVAHALEPLAGGPVLAAFTEQLKHVEWDGFHFFDLIFPLFLFLVGVSIVLSMEKILAGAGRKTAMLRILKRSVLLYVVGVFYYGGFSKPWPDIALSGVLPRIAVCYLIASMIYLWLPRKAVPTAAVLMLTGYWGMLSFVPFPDVNLKHSNVSRKSAQVQAKSPEEMLATATKTTHGTFEEGRNLAHYVDCRWLPGRKRNVYYTNEGLLSTIPAVATTLFGIMAGWLLTSSRWNGKQKALWLIGAGAAAVAAGLLWSIEFPMIKRIWTSSFCLVSGGCASAMLGLFFLVIDVWNHRKWCVPFLWIGSNALGIYLVVNIVEFNALAARFVGGDIARSLDTHAFQGAGNLAIALVGLALPVLIARFLFIKKIFFRL
jgi:predicted acyltransferase